MSGRCRLDPLIEVKLIEAELAEAIFTEALHIYS